MLCRAAKDMTQRKLHSLPILQHEPVTSAQAAGLRYFTDLYPGIRRQQQGENFWYQGVDGRRVRDPETLRRITLLVIPPAWTNVWICPDANGHLQATGSDNKGRKHYRYHPGGALFATKPNTVDSAPLRRCCHASANR